MIVKIVEYTHKIIQNILSHIQSFNMNYGKLNY